MKSEQQVKTESSAPSAGRLEEAANQLGQMIAVLASRERRESLKASLGGGAATDAESTDLAAAMTELLTSDSVASVLESRLAQAEHALDRLEAGLYGICEDCGASIPAERLEFQPEATRCVRCQQVWERQAAV